MSNPKVSTKCIKTVLTIIVLAVVLFCISSLAQAQWLYKYMYPYMYPFSLYSPYYSNNFPVPIRFNPFQSYPGFFSIPSALPLPVFPPPVVRRAATTITIWNTVGKTTVLIVYNPTLLIGPTSVPVTPSPLLSLLAGQLLVFGGTPLSTVNPAFFNYLVNTYLLPTGLAIYVI